MDEIVSKILHTQQTKQPIEFISHHSIDEKTSYAVQDELIKKKMRS